MRRHSVCCAMLGVLLMASLSFAQPAESKLPEGLRHVPLDALGFVHIRVGEFLKSPIGKTLLQELRKDREASKGLKEIEQSLSLNAGDVESITLVRLPFPTGPQMFWDGPNRGPMFDGPLPPAKRMVPKIEEKKAVEKQSAVLYQPLLPFVEGADQPMQGMDPRQVGAHLATPPLMIVTSTKPLDQRKILRANLLQEDIKGSVLFLSDRAVMIGMPWELSRYSEMMARKKGPKTEPLRSALALAAGPHLVVAGGHLPAELRAMMMSPFGPDIRLFAAVSPLLQTEIALALNLDKGIGLKLHFLAANETSAGHVLQAAKSLRVLAEIALEKSREGGESGGWKLDLEKGLAKALADATFEQTGSSVRSELKMEVSPAVLKRATQEIVASLRSKGDRVRSVNNLKQIGLALHGYHDANKALPPAGLSSVKDPMGKPLLSWRVAILPYIDQAPLYQQFDLTQAWDHPTNKKLIAKMPAIYVLPGAETKEGMTHYRVLVGPSTMFESGRKIRLIDITDGTSNTIMAVEAKEPTIWTRPDDLPFDPKGALPKFGVSPDGFNALFGDGAVHFIRAGTPADVLRAYITRDGGEAVQFPD